MPISESEKQTFGIAEKLAEKLANGGVICLFGELGSGKTTFTKGLARFFGLENFQIKSPTYTYIRKYTSKSKHDIYHVDLYRIDAPDILLLEEIQELMQNPHNILIIEWADKIQDYLPAKRLNVFFEYIDEQKRKITHEEQ